VLAPLAKPIAEINSKRVFMGGEGRLSLVAMLHRSYWVAGQQCFIRVNVSNGTKKTIRSLTLTLVCVTTLHRPKSQSVLDTATIADSTQYTSTMSVKQVAESRLDMGQAGASGHASAKGWWTGVHPQEQTEFGHFLLIPVRLLHPFLYFF
jgi:hypothetical protein